MKCKECGSQVASGAKACPSCGAKPPAKTSALTWILAGIFAIAIINAFVSAGKTSDSPPVQAAPAPPPIQKSPELLKEIARLDALSGNDFCLKELPKVKKIKGAWPQPWGDALTAAIARHGVTQAHISAIKDGGALVGMSKCGALAGWGRPQKVNTTTTKRGSREQWVYGNSSYLYFDGELLTTIQN